VMTVAYVPQQAPDTATVLAMGCTEIVMHKTATLGDFSQFVEADRDHTLLRIKALSALAEEQGYPPLLVRGMLDPQVTIYWASNLKDGRERRFLTEGEMNEDKKRAQPIWGRELLVKAGGENGKLLVLNSKDASDLGFIRHTVDGVGDLYAI